MPDFSLPVTVFHLALAVVTAAAELGSVGDLDRLLGDDQARSRGDPAFHAAVQRAGPPRGIYARSYIRTPSCYSVTG